MDKAKNPVFFTWRLLYVIGFAEHIIGRDRISEKIISKKVLPP